uniref:Immunoglobulin V-set domain-containing protein n=1 Tax=Castor canadensis TaxID=51338 RepID=A0A8C0WVL9_CASCN
MAWGHPHRLLHPVLVVLLVSGSWEATDELHEVAGQTLSVRCQYPPKRGSYVLKYWCHQTAPNKCTRLVTTSQPWIAAEVSRHTIWDVPEAGFFIIIMIQLREEDTGFYWCGSFNSSQNVITVFRNISLVVSPGEKILPLLGRNATCSCPVPLSLPILMGLLH